jgi:hypothetical protein
MPCVGDSIIPGRMPRQSAGLTFSLVLIALIAGCSRKVDDARPLATPTLTLSRTDVAVGSPIDVTYRFAVAADAPPFSEDYTVFVHVLDKDRGSMWGDDHQPPTPTTQWKPGTTVEYTRTMFVPKLPYVGPAQIEVGLYSIKSGQRLPLGGENTGDRSIRVANFNMQLPANALFIVFRDGWHDAEVSGEAGVEWQWSKKQGTLSFRNPKQDANFIIDLDQPVQAFTEPQKVEIKVGDAVVDTFALAAGRRELRRISLTAAQLGPAETVDAVVAVDKTFVPASVPQLKSLDPRELGVRVFHAFVEPKQ